MAIRQNQWGLGLIVVPILILVVLIAGMGAYYVYSKGADEEVVIVEENPTQKTQTTEPANKNQTSTDAYTDACSGLVLDTPKAWTYTEGGSIKNDEARCNGFYATTATGNTLYWTTNFYGDGPGLCFDDPANCAKVSVIAYEKLPTSAGLLSGMYAVKTKSCYANVDSCLGAVFLLSSEKDPATLINVDSLSVVVEIPKALVRAGKTVTDAENANRSWVALSMMQHKSGNIAGSGEVQVSTKTSEDYEGAIVFTSAETDTWLASEDAQVAFDAIKGARL